MPRALAASPRKMLPPPMTIAVCTPRRLDFRDVFGDAGGDGRVHAVALVAHEGFAGQLQKDALVGGLGRVGRTDMCDSNYTGEHGARWCAGCDAVRPRAPCTLGRLLFGRFAELEAGEARDGDVFAGLGRGRLAPSA